MTSQRPLSLCLLPIFLLTIAEARHSTPLRLPPVYLPEGNSACPPEEQRQAQKRKINRDVADLIQHYLHDCDAGLTADTAVRSCAAIPFLCNSSIRYVTTTDGKQEQVYCETNPPFATGTWQRLASINMEESAHTCPHGWTETMDPDHKIRACGRDLTQEQQVATATFSTNDINYSRVCGRITAYQFGATAAFTTNQTATLTDPYVDGVSITYGGYSGHIWTFAAATAQQDPSRDNVCPCTNPSLHQNANIYVPSFVGRDYFCEIAVSGSEAYDSQYYAENALWDGEDCFGSSTCCEFNRPPWFCKNLTAPTAQEIEIRIMNFATEGQKLDGEDTVIQKLDLYVQ